MTSNKGKKDFPSLLLYLFGFGLLWEWVRPLEEITDTGNIEIFLIYLGLAMLLSFWDVRFWWSFFINGIYILFALKSIYLKGPSYAFSWIAPLMKDFARNVVALLSWDIQNLSNMFRSLLFFLLLSIMVYLLRYWLFTKRQIFVYFFMTVIYITVLDTFTAYRGNQAIVRTVFFGFLIMGILYFYRISEKNELQKKIRGTRKWMIGITSLIALSVAVGFVSPKLKPVWPDPVPYLKSYSEGRGIGGSQKVGIGSDDSHLGGSLQSDNTIIFTAESASRHYWKVETKDVYTGKGWVTSEDYKGLRSFTQMDIPPVSSFSTNVESTRESATIAFEKPSDYLIYTMGVQWFLTDSSITFEMEADTEKIYSVKNAKRSPIYRYSLTYEVPKYSVTDLVNSNTTVLELSSTKFLSHYTQLPETLPQRVKDLAQEIASGKETWFEKAKAIEEYFNSSDFVYDRSNVLKPGKDDDYVDQFLFDSKRGYCNNFSTSMVVMLRSLGIPSRWVKGYTEGEFKRLSEDGNRVFEITNNDAHSWVEVYFPSIGWVPFEPTKSFSSNVQFNYDTYKQEQKTNEMDSEDSKPKSEPKKETPDKPKQKKGYTILNLGEDIKDFMVHHKKGLILVGMIFSGAVVFIYRKRSRWLPYFYIWKFGRRNEDESFVKAYNELIKQFERLGIKRKRHQTLRSFANYIDYNFGTSDMSKITATYEEYMYKGSLKKGTWEEQKDRWKNLIKMTIA